MKLLRKESLQIILTDVIVWTTSMLFYSVLRFTALNNDPMITLSDQFNYEMVLTVTVEAGLLLGLIFGVVDVFLDQAWLRKQPFGRVLVIKGAIHLVIIIFISIAVRLRAFEFLGIEANRETMSNAVFNAGLLVILIYTTIVSFLLNFGRQINEKFGPGNLWKFITGRFHQPKEEQRIFMFLDLRSSTTIAEKLGHIKFSQLLQDCFQDLAVVSRRKAQVYQYVGDEAILTWDLRKGIHNCNCLWAYQDFQSRLLSKDGYYQSHYGVSPQFKAGLNLGKVTVAEIGSIKREIAFHGDTLNTAARIQDQCNVYEQEVLISEVLHNELPQEQGIERKCIGNFTLKGKQETVAIYAVAFNN